MVNKFLHKNNSKYWAGLLFAQFILFYILSQYESFSLLFLKIFDFKKEFHQETFSYFNISMGDLFYIFLVIFFLNSIKKAFKSKNFSGLLKSINILYFVYQICWGMMYFQKPIYQNQLETEVSTQELEKLAIKYIKLTNEARKKVNQDKNGVFITKNTEIIKKEILKYQHQIPKEFLICNPNNINNFKPSLYGKIMNYTGILGYYNPFTSEAQYNPNLPSSYIPFTLAHESAHQLGFAREQEANFIGYLICRSSNNPELEYSAYLYTTKVLLYNLEEENPDFVKKAKLEIEKSVKRDLENEEKFYSEHYTIINDFFRFTNDLFLKSNRQEGSVTYSYFVYLLAHYEKLNP